MSATQQTLGDQHIGAFSFVLDCDRDNDALLTPRPKLKSYWGLARSVPSGQEASARALMRQFESLVLTKFNKEMSAPKWQVWKRTWIKFDPDERSKSVEAKMKEWYQITENLISAVHREHQTEMDDLGWELYTRPEFDNYMKTLTHSKARFRNSPYPPYTGYSGRVRQTATQVQVQPPMLPSIPDWLNTLPGNSVAIGAAHGTSLPRPGSHVGFDTTASAYASAGIIPSVVGLSSTEAAAPGFNAALPSAVEVSPIGESDFGEGPSRVWSPLGTERHSVVSYEVSPI